MMLLRALVVAGLLIYSREPAAEPPATSYRSFIAGPEWRRAIQQGSVCIWWDSYERRNTYNPMDRDHRWAMERACYAGDGLLGLVRWGREVEPERPPKRIWFKPHCDEPRDDDSYNCG